MVEGEWNGRLALEAPVGELELGADGLDTPVASWILLAVERYVTVIWETYSSDASERT